jgi:hypothetical protein
MSTSTLVVPDRIEIEKETNGLIIRAQNVVAIITNDAGYAKADEERKFFREGKKKTVEKFLPVKASAAKTHKEVCALETFALQPWDDGYTLIERGMMAYKREQDRKAQEAQEKAAADARKRQEEESLMRAQTMQDEGRPEEAAAILEAPPAPIPVAPVAAPPKLTKGSSVRENWTFVVEDETKIVEMLIDCISGGKSFADLSKVGDLIRDFFTLDPKKVGAFVRSQKKGAVGRIPGVRVWNDEKIV